MKKIVAFALFISVNLSLFANPNGNCTKEKVIVKQ